MKAVFVVNPAAGHGRGQARWEKALALASVLHPDHEVLRTEGIGHGRALARRAVESGARLIVAVGGDGTLNEVVDGFLTASDAARAGAVVATFPAGSGCDFALHSGVPREPEAWARALAAGRVRRLDAGRATYRGPAGEERARHFLNLAALCLPGDVALAVAKRGKPLGGTLTYLLEGTLAALTGRSRRLRLVVDGIAEEPADYYFVAAANTSTSGGGMIFSPEADMEDGLFDLVTIGGISRAALLGLLPHAYSGGHIGRPGVRLRRARRIEAYCDEPAPLNLDGEAEGVTPAVFEALPGRLPFLL